MILVVGGTGYLGGTIVEELIRQGIFARYLEDYLRPGTVVRQEPGTL